MIWALIPIQISPGSHLGSYNQWVPGALFSGERSWGMKLRSHLHLVVGLRRSGGVTLLHLRAFVAWTGTSWLYLLTYTVRGLTYLYIKTRWCYRSLKCVCSVWTLLSACIHGRMNFDVPQNSDVKLFSIWHWFPVWSFSFESYLIVVFHYYQYIV
jgi:hypothetical protein